MNNEYMYSIIIPHYNTPDLLEILLDSIPSRKDIQVIVVDDKSDLHLELLRRVYEKFANRNIEFYLNTGIKSAGTCRNIGLEKALGKWLIFADADDFFVDNCFSILDSHNEEDVDIIYFSPTSIKLGTNELSDRHIGYQKKVEAFIQIPTHENELELRYNFQGPVSKMILRELVVDKTIWFSETIASNDVMFSTKTGYVAKKINAYDEIIYCITMGKGSLTNNIEESIFDIRTQIFLERYQFLYKI